MRARALLVPGLAAALLVSSSLGSCSCGGEPKEAPGAAPVDLRTDRRLVELLAPCANNAFYDRDLSDPVPVLVEKLERGRPDPMKRAKQELGDQGEAAFPALAHFFQRSYADQMRSPYLENAVDALAFNATDVSHELLLEASLHPQESVRSKALDGLRRHARAEDFERLAPRLLTETVELRRQIVSTLWTMDPARMEELVLGWLDTGERRELLGQALPPLAESKRETTAARCAALFGRFEPVLAAPLVACAANAGDANALAYLRAELRHESPDRRLSAVTAAARAGLADELEHSLLEDPMEQARVLSIAGVDSRPELGEPQRTWLHAALNDPSPVVQAEVLRVLCAHDDPEAISQALFQLDAEAGLLQSALLALREPMRRDETLARTALDRLFQRHGLEEDRPVQQRTATLKAIAQVPLRDAAVFLRRTGQAAAGETIESLRAHEWLMIQASNTGLEGRRFLSEEIAAEPDPRQRIDLMDAVGSERDELARTVLLALVDDRRLQPLERLFAASALIRIGPSWEVAPRLKRVAFAMVETEELEARNALQCLLWTWY